MKTELKYLRLLHENAPEHKACTVAEFLESEMVTPGLPLSVKKFWKMKNVPGQGKVREFHFQSGKFRKMKKVMEKSGNFKNFKKMLVNWLLVFHKLQAILEKECSETLLF